MAFCNAARSHLPSSGIAPKSDALTTVGVSISLRGSARGKLPSLAEYGNVPVSGGTEFCAGRNWAEKSASNNVEIFFIV